ncbi:MAG: triose-phosphate isomerase [Bdellovibrionales bacterium]
MMDFVCAGNWKMNKNPAEAEAFAKTLREMAEPKELEYLVLFPPALSAYALAAQLKGSPVRWGGQNIYPANNGAFTGENSPLVLKEMGAGLCLVGHSERRHIFGEPDESLARKVQFLQAAGMTPVLCVGETIDDRRWNRTQEVILRQARHGLQSADPALPLWLAYEPVWAIGTGEVATPAQVEEAHGMLRNYLKEWSSAHGADIPVLYGGSVKADNVEALAPLPNVNGFLIGGASLDPKELLTILRHSHEARGE